jgi:hypothetical protein
VVEYLLACVRPWVQAPVLQKSEGKGEGKGRKKEREKELLLKMYEELLKWSNK